MATGKVTELGRATKGLAIDWVTERKLVVAGDNGVSIVDLDGAPTHTIEGATKLVVPKKRARCAEEPDPEPLIEDQEASDSSSTVEPIDGKVVEPPASVKPSPP